MATIVENYLDASGRRNLIIDVLTGPVERVVHMIATGLDANTFAAAVEAAHLEIRKQREIAVNIGMMLSMASAPITLIHCTQTEMRNALRAAYKGATKTEAVFLGMRR